jgi:hypothetical protein
MDGLTIRQRFDALYSTRTTLDDTLQKIEQYVVPYRGDFFDDEMSEAEVEWRRRGIYDSTAPIAADLLASSIHSNLTSPMIPWFNLRFRNDELNAIQEAKEWLEGVQSQIWQTLRESDFNMEIAEVYLDLVSYGTAFLFQEELSDDRWEGMTFTSLPVRDTYFENGADDKVLRVYRRLRMTKLQLEDKFPDYDFGFIAEQGNESGANVDEKHRVIFCVYKRDEVEKVSPRMKPEARPWGYKYVMHSTAEVLEEGGYYQMPAHVVRWKKVSGSVWGHSPAFVSLSDIMQLNQTVAQSSEARAKEIDPPMKTTERGIIGDLDLLPGGLTMVMEMDELDRLLPPHNWMVADAEILRLQTSIRSTFYVDKLELKESPAMTATEVLARLDKQQRQFAPTLGRLEYDLLDPTIEWTFDALMRNKLVPPLPDVLKDQDIDIEYTGPIPRSMKNEEAQGTSMWLQEMTMLSQQGLPDMVDIIDTDRTARGLGLARGVPAVYMRNEDEVSDIREARQAQQQQMMELQMAQEAGKAMGEVGAGQEAMEGAEGAPPA